MRTPRAVAAFGAATAVTAVAVAAVTVSSTSPAASAGVAGVARVVPIIADALRKEDRTSPGLFSAFMRRASGRGAGLAVRCLLPAVGRRSMRMASRLMAPAAGKRWLAEADSFLFETPPTQQGKAIRNYLRTAPLVIVVSWASALAHQIRVTGSGPAARRSDADPRG